MYMSIVDRGVEGLLVQTLGKLAGQAEGLLEQRDLLGGVDEVPYLSAESEERMLPTLFYGLRMETMHPTQVLLEVGSVTLIVVVVGKVDVVELSLGQTAQDAVGLRKGPELPWALAAPVRVVLHGQSAELPTDFPVGGKRSDSEKLVQIGSLHGILVIITLMLI